MLDFQGARSGANGQPQALSSSDFEVLVVRDGKTLAALAPELDALALDSIETNPFYEPWMLLPALNHLASDDERIVIVRHARDGVTGLFPFHLKLRLRRLPVRVLESWRHEYCFLCTPIVSRVHGRATIQSLVAWLESSDAPASIVELELIAGDGPFWNLLADELRSRPKWKVRASSYERAVLVPTLEARTAISGKHRRELRRLERRLSERGICNFRLLRDDEPIQPWVDAFLALEQCGWKGRAGTALGSDEQSRQFFTEVTTNAKQRDKIQMLAIEVDGVPIAMKCNFVSNDTAFAFKIAYDERFSKYSPGVLLELFNMRNFVDNGARASKMDSCAVANHFMINRLWTGRRTMTTCLMACRGPGSLLLNHWPRLRQINRRISKRHFLRG